MRNETMTKQERAWAAINLEKPDRVPLGIASSAHSAAVLTNRSQAEIAHDPYAGMNSMLEVFDNFGGWDKVEYPFNLIPQRWTFTAGMTIKIPGVDLPDDYIVQPHEKENVKLEDYDIIADLGWTKFVKENLIYRISDMKQADVKRLNNLQAEVAEAAKKEWEKREVLLTCTAEDYHPFFKLSLGRSMEKFTEDLYYHPELVEKAMQKITEEVIEGLLTNAKKHNCKVVGVCEERAGGYFFPLKIFERFWWPYTEQIVNAMWSEGIVCFFHVDTDWTKNLPYFKRLPRGSAVISLDGMTDIFNAKEILRDHICIQGDIHPSLLTTGTPEEVEAYTKKLIDEVGNDGGFILGVGCEVPTSCKAENLAAMINTGKTYEWSK